jgi:cysteine-rich repeat protein
MNRYALWTLLLLSVGCNKPLVERLGAEPCDGREFAICFGDQLEACNPDVGDFKIFETCGPGFVCNEERIACTPCGNGTIDAGEQCDDSNATSGDGCNSACFFESVCGDGLIEGLELCDDSNVVSGDGCSSDCLSLEACGDRIVNTDLAIPESCDDGNNINGDGCDDQCQLESPPGCGDNLVVAPEECDDGNLANNDGCNAACRTERCGDNVAQTSEECDDGNNVSGDGCSDNCETEQNCGNEEPNPGEECDNDPNRDSNDGCSSLCQLEADLFVSCSDSSGGNGTLANPFRDLSDALDAANAGDVIMVLPQSPSNCRSISIDKSVTIQGLADPLAPNAPSLPTISGGVNLNNADGETIIFRDIELTSSSNFATIARSDSNASQNINLALLGVILRGGGYGAGLRLRCGNTCNILIDRSTIRSGDAGGTILDEKINAVIANSVFQGNDDDAIALNSIAPADEMDVVILLSTFQNNQSAINKPSSDGACRADGLIINNNNGLVPVVGCDTTFTDFFGLALVPLGNGNIIADPRFVDAGNGDFHLQNNSPCREAANTAQLVLPFDTDALFGVSSVYDHDFALNPRPSNGRNEMGMFEEP